MPRAHRRITVTTALLTVLLAGCSTADTPPTTTLTEVSDSIAPVSSSRATAEPSPEPTSSAATVQTSAVEASSSSAVPQTNGTPTGTEPLFPPGLTPEEQVQAQAALDVSIAHSEQVDAILQDPTAKDFWLDDLKLYMGAIAAEGSLDQIERYLAAGVHETGPTLRRYWVDDFTGAKAVVAQCVDRRGVKAYTSDGTDVTSLPDYASEPYLTYDIVEYDPPSQRWYVTGFEMDEPVSTC